VLVSCVHKKENAMKMIKIFTILIVTVMILVSFMPVRAITDGQPDGDGHPYVGLMGAYDGNGDWLWRCSGTLISPTVFLTAGHCTEPPAVRAQIWFEEQIDIGLYGYPDTGDVAGDTFTHPDFNFPFYDVGVVVLDEPVYLNEYGVLPALNQLDGLKTRRGLKDVTFTAVGYGLQQSLPDPAYWLTNNVRHRMVAYPHLLQINVPGFTGDFSLLLSNNANTGGTCFGDSGGPNFLGTSNVIAAVTSYGINGNCAGTGGVYRMDRQDALDFVNGFLNQE
jgi:hypothetical protein